MTDQLVVKTEEPEVRKFSDSTIQSALDSVLSRLNPSDHAMIFTYYDQGAKRVEGGIAWRIGGPGSKWTVAAIASKDLDERGELQAGVVIRKTFGG